MYIFSPGILESPTFNWWIIFETLFQVVNIWMIDFLGCDVYWKFTLMLHCYRDYVQMCLCPVTLSLGSVGRQMNSTGIHLASWRWSVITWPTSLPIVCEK